MKIWIGQNRDVVFRVTLGGYATIKGNYHYINNKRSKIKEEDIICLSSSLSYDFPPDFIAMYYSEDIKYWHELRELIKGSLCMKLWLSHIGSAIYVLIEDPKRNGYIEANIYSLKIMWYERRHKRINLKSLTKMWCLPRECFRFNHFPIGYRRNWFYERPSIYFHEIKKIYDNSLDN